MTNYAERRRFERLIITEATVAVDESGFQLGRVLQASGGGMQLHAFSSEATARMKLGTRMEVTVVEPSLKTTNSFNVEVRHVDGLTIGMEFI